MATYLHRPGGRAGVFYRSPKRRFRRLRIPREFFVRSRGPAFLGGPNDLNGDECCADRTVSLPLFATTCFS